MRLLKECVHKPVQPCVIIQWYDWVIANKSPHDRNLTLLLLSPAVSISILSSQPTIFQGHVHSEYNLTMSSPNTTLYDHVPVIYRWHTQAGEDEGGVTSRADTLHVTFTSNWRGWMVAIRHARQFCQLTLTKGIILAYFSLFDKITRIKWACPFNWLIKWKG